MSKTLEQMLDEARVPREVFIGTDSPLDRVEWLLRRVAMLERGRDTRHAQLEAAQERERVLQAGVRELLGQACGLKDGLFGWFWQCRHCRGSSPDVGLKHQALESDIEHAAGCVVTRMRELVETTEPQGANR